MDGHVHLNLGNIIVIGGVAFLTLMGTLAVVHVLSNKDVPVVSPAARGVADVFKSVAA